MQESSCLERFLGAEGNFPWDLADAFDAACNGLENPEALARMEFCGGEFADWKQLVHAIRAMYNGDEESCRRALASIETSSPPGSLKDLFSDWISGVKTAVQKEKPKANNSGKVDFGTGGAVLSPVKELYQKLLIDPHPLRGIAEQADEALRQGMTGHFERLSQSVFRGLQEERRCDGALLALRYARYCLFLLDKEGYTQTDFFSLIIRVLGRADGFFVIGLSLLDNDAEAALEALTTALETRAPDARDCFLNDEMAAAVRVMTALIREEAPGAGSAKTAVRSGARS
ncbi:MAG: hypothetical protein LBH73_04935, partial [Spirochaetaceae bacterium]|nr:hypothetical protein [Spirochaetaceae bacterium]